MIPLGLSDHIFNYTVMNQEGTYTPPDIGLPSHITRREYNLAEQLTSIIRPDGQRIDFGYDFGGRLDGITLPRGTRSYSYDPVTGNLATLTATDGSVLGYSYNADLITAESLTGTVAGTVGFGYDTERRIGIIGR